LTKNYMNNDNEPEIDVPEENESAGLPVLVTGNQPAKNESTPQVTASQAKIQAVADLTHSAYQKASSLKLSKEESDALQADFPDDAFKPGAGGNASLLYIEHAFLRDRFISVFGMGQWAIIPRRTWSETFKTIKGVEGERVYVEAMLIVRECFVAEAVGSMEYYHKNEGQNYGDAVEGAKTAAFRRCAKEFGVGLQTWKKDWCDGWWARKNARSKKTNRVEDPGPTTPVEVPRDEPEPDAGDEWREFPMPWGDKAGIALEDLGKPYLYGLWANFEPSDTFKDKKTGQVVNKKPETVAKEKVFRQMLDQAGAHYNFTKR
jgi:hypothetical protein